MLSYNVTSQDLNAVARFYIVQLQIIELTTSSAMQEITDV